MDSITQFLLGAAIGDGFYRKKIGHSAKWWGGIAGTLPDLDIFFYRTPFDYMTVHRGYSHSLIVTVLGGLLLGYIFSKVILYHQTQGRFITSCNKLGDWCGIMVLGLVTHPLLDWFTTYGTQLMLPFNNNRYSLHAIGIIDPFYSLWLLGGLICSPWLTNLKNNYYAQIALLISTLYLGYCYWINQQALKIVHKNLETTKIKYTDVHCYPTLFQPYLRTVVVQTDQQFNLTTISMWKIKKLNTWQVINKMKSSQLNQFQKHPTAKIFYWFADNQVLSQQWQSGPSHYRVRLSDMRFLNWMDITQPMWGIEAIINSENEIINLYSFRFTHQPKPLNFVGYWGIFKKSLNHIWHQAFASNSSTLS